MNGARHIPRFPLIAGPQGFVVADIVRPWILGVVTFTLFRVWIAMRQVPHRTGETLLGRFAIEGQTLVGNLFNDN